MACGSSTNAELKTALLSAHLWGHPISYSTSDFVISVAVALLLMCSIFFVIFFTYWKFMHLEMLVEAFSKLKTKQIISLLNVTTFMWSEMKKQARGQICYKRMLSRGRNTEEMKINTWMSLVIFRMKIFLSLRCRVVVEIEMDNRLNRVMCELMFATCKVFPI